jgi:glutamine synthetase
MAKPHNNLPGCSGHLHFSLRDKNGKNLFYNESDPQKVSDALRYFIAGVMNGLPSVMALFAPTINSYKRLNAAYWAPVTVSYGFEDRGSAIRIITPPICSPMATRIEVRVPGADVNAYLACAGVLACGYDGIDKKMELPELVDPTTCPALPRTLHDAVNKMDEKGSVCRSLLGDEFVDHFVATRQHELRLWNQTVTSWEVKRYIETV